MKCKTWNKLLSALMALTMALSLLPTAALAAGTSVEVGTFAELKDAVGTGGEIKLTSDITTTEALVTSGVNAVIDLNGQTLTIGAGDNKFNDASDITIQNGNVSITGVTVSGNAIFCLDEYEESQVTKLTLENVNLTGDGYSSAYGIFYIGDSSVLTVSGGVWDLTNDTHTSGGVFKADDSKATLNITGLKLTAHNVRRVVTYAAATIENSTMTVSGDADGVDAEMEHGFNRSPLTIKGSTITMKDMAGRGITAQNGAVSIENSTVTMTNVQEATIDVRDNQTVTVDTASTVTVDKSPTVADGCTISGNVTVRGTGSETDPYLINDLDDLKRFRDDVNAGNNYSKKYVKLTADIDLKDEDWTPIGSGSNPFAGSFDGDGHTISNLYIKDGLDYYNGGEHYVGLFGYVKNGGCIKNMTIENVDVTGCLYVGALVGRVYIGGVIENCRVKGDIDIEGYWYVGGIAGRYEYATGISNCSVAGSADRIGTIEADVDAATNKDEDGGYAGGIVGFVAEGNYYIKDCSVEYVTISGDTRVGGVSGIGHYGNTIEGCSVTNVTIQGGDGATTIGTIVGATQGTDTQPTTVIGSTATDTVAKAGETVVDGLYGTNIDGAAPVTNWAAQVDGALYESLQDAVDAVGSGDTVKLLRNINVNAGANAVSVTGGASFTLDLNGKTMTANTTNAAIRININNDAVTAPVTINIKNGTVTAGSSAYCALIASGKSKDVTLTVNLNDVALNGSNPNGCVVKVFPNASVNVNDGTVITGEDSYGCMEVMGAANIYDGAELYQKGTTSYNGCIVGVSGDGAANIYGGKGESAKTGLIVMTSGGTLHVSGGEWSAASAVLTAQNDKSSYPNGGDSVINVSGGSFQGEISDWGNGTGSVGKTTVSGGTFDRAVAAGNCAEGYEPKDNGDNTYGVKVKDTVAMVAQINGGTQYTSLDKALAAARSGDTVKLLKDMELTDKIVVSKKNITFDGDGHKITQAEGMTLADYGAALRFDGDSSDISKYTYTVKNIVFDGWNTRSVLAIHQCTATVDHVTIQNGTWDEAAQAMSYGLLYLENTEITVKNSTFANNDGEFVLTYNYGSPNSTAKLTMDECVFSNNKVGLNAAVAYYVTGSGCTITHSEFVGNNVITDGNGAALYLGVQENCTVTGCLFQDNTVHSTGTGTRVAGGLFFGYEADISGNAFVNNKATNANNDALGQSVCTSTYYQCTISLNGNYWGGEPVEGVDYLIQHKTGEGAFRLNTFYKAYTLDSDGNVVVSQRAFKAAMLNGVRYDTLDEAVAAVKNGETIILLADNSQTVTVAKTISFTVDPDGNTCADFVCGSYTKVTTADNGDGTITYIFKRVLPASGGGSPSGATQKDPTYGITKGVTENGTLSVDLRVAKEGDTVILAATPNAGYEVGEVTVTDARGNAVTVTGADGKYTFAMPAAAVTVRAAFTQVKAEGEKPDDTSVPCDGGTACPVHEFEDVDVTQWYHTAVDYVVDNGIMGGYNATTFGPEDTLSRAMLVQMLYNYADKPAVEGGAVFEDVLGTDWYAAAVTWAANEGVIGGYGSSYKPDQNITRQELAQMLYNYAGKPAAEGDLSKFGDADQVDGWAKNAITWAVANGVMGGKGGNILDPLGQATRAEAAQMLMSFLKNGKD